MGDIEQCTPICTCFGTIVSILWELWNKGVVEGLIRLI